MATALPTTDRLAEIGTKYQEQVVGADRAAEHDHLQLWLNIVHWLAAPAYHRVGEARARRRESAASAVCGPRQRSDTVP